MVSAYSSYKFIIRYTGICLRNLGLNYVVLWVKSFGSGFQQKYFALILRNIPEAYSKVKLRQIIE